MSRKSETPAPPPGSPDEEEQAELDDNPDAESNAAQFSIEAIVKQLPEGVVLCPTCLGMLGVVEEPPYDPRAHACEVCRGMGTLRTGSLVGGKGERPCWACAGVGWIEAHPGEPDALPARAAFFADPDVRPVDVNGRTPDDPEFDWSRVAPPVEQAPPVDPSQEPTPAAPAPV